MTKTKLLFTVLLSILLQSKCFVPLHIYNTQTYPSELKVASWLFDTAKTQKNKQNRNNNDNEYPWKFTGRLWFRPSFVKIRDSISQLPNHVIPLHLFGYTLGGLVALEYDTSPIGPYKEYVTMGSLVISTSKDSKLYAGQWGENLYVSTKPAVSVCENVWGVPAQLAQITFDQTEDNNLVVESFPQSQTKNIKLNGWQNTKRRLVSEDEKRNLFINMLWTPTIKALWLPFSLPFLKAENEQTLPLHKLRLSASDIGIVSCYQKKNDQGGFPFPFGLIVDNVWIEISEKIDEM